MLPAQSRAWSGMAAVKSGLLALMLLERVRTVRSLTRLAVLQDRTDMDNSRTGLGATSMVHVPTEWNLVSVSVIGTWSCLFPLFLISRRGILQIPCPDPDLKHPMGRRPGPAVPSHAHPVVGRVRRCAPSAESLPVACYRGSESFRAMPCSSCLVVWVTSSGGKAAGRLDH